MFDEEDLGEAFGHMNEEWLEEKIIDFGCSMDTNSAMDVINRLNALSTLQKIRNDDIVDGLIALIINQKKSTLTMDVIHDYETQILSKGKAQTPSTSSVNHISQRTPARGVLKDIPIPISDDNEKFDFMDEDKQLDWPKDEIIPSNIINEKSRGKRLHLGKLFSKSQEGDNVSENLLALKVLSNCSRSSYGYGHDNLVFDLTDLMDELNELTDEAEPNTDIGVSQILTGYLLPLEGRAFNSENIALFRGVGRPVLLNFQRVDRYALFHGKKLTLRGAYNNKGEFVIEKLIDSPQLPLANLNRSSSFSRLKVLIAAGPFSMNDDSSMDENFVEFAKQIKIEGANLVVLIGPFVTKNAVLDSKSPDDIFKNYMECLSKIAAKWNIRIVVVANSMNDLNSMPQFPTPPYEPINNLDERVTLLPDPAIFEVEGVQFAITASEILMHLSRHAFEESMNKENEDRMQRLISYIFTEKSFYPLYPPDPSISLALRNARTHLKLSKRPHVFIAPSILQPIARVVEDCITINPGRFVRDFKEKRTGGTYASLEIDLAATYTQTVNSVAQTSQVQLFVV